jgi:hypothetical protein
MSRSMIAGLSAIGFFGGWLLLAIGQIEASPTTTPDTTATRLRWIYLPLILLPADLRLHLGALLAASCNTTPLEQGSCQRRPK